MRTYLVKIAVPAFLLFSAGNGFGQEEKTTTETHRNEDVIVITPKTDITTKLTIEIKGDDVKVNGQPLSEYKNDDISITKRKSMNAKTTKTTRFRSGGNVYGYGSSDNMVLNGLDGPGNLALAGTISNKAFLGVGTEKADEGEGVTITSITDESAAEKAGLKEGDLITRINDTKIGSPAELVTAIGRFKPDEKIIITYKRDKKEQKASAVLTKRKTTNAIGLNAPYLDYQNFNFDDNYSLNWGKPRLGLKAQETEDGKGLKVLDVDDESTADKAGIKEGDIITSFDGSEVNNIDTLRELSKPAMEKGNFKVKLTRDGQQKELEVKIPKKLKTTSL